MHSCRTLIGSLHLQEKNITCPKCRKDNEISFHILGKYEGYSKLRFRTLQSLVQREDWTNTPTFIIQESSRFGKRKEEDTVDSHRDTIVEKSSILVASSGLLYEKPSCGKLCLPHCLFSFVIKLLEFKLLQYKYHKNIYL